MYGCGDGDAGANLCVVWLPRTGQGLAGEFVEGLEQVYSMLG